MRISFITCQLNFFLSKPKTHKKHTKTHRERQGSLRKDGGGDGDSEGDGDREGDGERGRQR